MANIYFIDEFDAVNLEKATSIFMRNFMIFIEFDSAEAERTFDVSNRDDSPEDIFQEIIKQWKEGK